MQSPSDAWDQPTAQSARVKRYVEPIRDDWDDSSEEEPETEADNQKIWDAANTKAPMPELVISSSNTSPPPPPSALQRPMRILKRPTATNLSPNTTQTGTANESMAEREARYHAARERIFGAEEQREQETVVVRNPRGPTEEGGEPTKGFGGRRRKKGTPDTN